MFNIKATLSFYKKLCYRGQTTNIRSTKFNLNNDIQLAKNANGMICVKVMIKQTKA